MSLSVLVIKISTVVSAITMLFTSLTSVKRERVLWYISDGDMRRGLTKFETRDSHFYGTFGGLRSWSLSFLGLRV